MAEIQSLMHQLSTNRILAISWRLHQIIFVAYSYKLIKHWLPIPDHAHWSMVHVQMHSTVIFILAGWNAVRPTLAECPVTSNQPEAVSKLVVCM